jgi:hypothetical protein
MRQQTVQSHSSPGSCAKAPGPTEQSGRADESVKAVCAKELMAQQLADEFDHWLQHPSLADIQLL